MGHTLAEKILMHNTGVTDCKPGDIVITHPDCVMFHDIYTTNVYRKFKEMGFTKSWDPEKVIIMFDHLLPTCLPLDGDHLKHGYQFAEEFGARKVHAGDGICHQLMPELGYARPGDVVFVTDSHTTTYGGVSAFATGIGYTEMAAVLGTGEMWVRVPSAIKIRIDGTLPDGVCSKDIALRVLGDLKAAGGTYKSLEFCGSTIDAMPVDERLTIANMAVECGAKVGLFAPTKESCAYSHVNYDDVSWLHFDDDAIYEKTLTYRSEELVPYIAAHPYVDNVKPLTELEGMKVDKVFIGSCTNGRLEDLAVAAKILEGKTVACRTIITPASRKIYIEAIKAGYMETLAKAGAIITQPGCGLCCGRAGGILCDGEKVLATNNRNFLGRMGTSKVGIYLGSPATAATSAVYGKITLPK